MIETFLLFFFFWIWSLLGVHIFQECWLNQCSSSQEGVSPPGNFSLMWNCLRVCSSCCWLPAKYAAMALWKRISWLCKTFTWGKGNENSQWLTPWECNSELKVRKRKKKNHQYREFKRHINYFNYISTIKIYWKKIDWNDPTFSNWLFPKICLANLE